MKDSNSKKLKEILYDFYELGVEDGFARHQFECAQDDYDAEIWFEYIKNKFTKKYNIDIKKYNNEDPWENADWLNSDVKKNMINKIFELIEENHYGFRQMADDILDNIYYQNEVLTGKLSIDQIMTEMNYFVGSLDEEKLLKEIQDTCKEYNITIEY